MFYHFNNCFKKMDYQQRSLPMIGHQISESVLGSFARAGQNTIFVSSPHLAHSGKLLMDYQRQCADETIVTAGAAADPAE
jgi:predicted HAD superfamily phosphohydrolase YqeG